MTYDEARALIAAHTDCMGRIDDHGLAIEIEAASALATEGGESRSKQETVNVPAVPTEEMIRAACLAQSKERFGSYEAWFDSHSGGVSERIRELVTGDYLAMIAAAPQSQVSTEGGEAVCVGCEGNPTGDNVPCAVCGGKPRHKADSRQSLTSDDLEALYSMAQGTGKTNYMIAARAFLQAAPQSQVDSGERKASARDRARRFVSDFTCEMGFAMSDHAQETMLNLFLRHAAPQSQGEKAVASGNLLDAVERTIETLNRQIALIAERAPGQYLDKMPVVRSLNAHARRLTAAIAKEKQDGAAQ
ncbi:hypothetical protein [Caballeronia sp. LZ043]|uniref:hypothetical protein n=1 Tax=Caballeronia sp. LZ043 TaxID=3038569 RepID=UPI00285CC4DA|nr:hypothetical protein [Caballeronia sp. LZ043]MDR5824724.1 hypothetical protein [Caballeronia sp. LZ043]